MAGPIINDTPIKTKEKKITIDPITRLEGHGKIEIFLNDQGNVENAYLQVPELRGFERFCIGRHVMELPVLTNRLCGVCPAAHHIASTKALDAVFDAKPTATALKLRELFYMGQYTHSHIAHFYALAAPDFVLGPSAPANKRNVLGVVDAVGVPIGAEVIKHRSYGQKVQEIIGGRATHPVFGLPGGVSKQISEEERAQIEEMAKSCVEFGKFTIKLFHDVVLANKDYMNLVLNQDAYYLNSYYMGMVDKDNKTNFYDGDIRVVDQTGKEVLKFKPSQYLDVIAEHVEPWTYMKMPFLKKVGWKGFVTGPDSGIYRVGPLGRINVCSGYTTPLAQKEYEFLAKTVTDLGVKGPVNHTLAYHWARVIELQYAAERMLQLASDKSITSDDVRGPFGQPKEGVGICEAPRGTLIHHYASDKDGLCTKINMIVATTNNYAAINTSVIQAAKALIKNGEVSPGLLNKVEMAFRCYDPCNSCGTHALNGGPALEITVKRRDGSVLTAQKNF
ncbi:MAG: F420-nonreducing hydrogenase [Euryarchaeota archaeon RBG_13_61_15]|jgi:F420-non-reducing hydrogenase large subunit|nr:MAG: F420-nonreducing hydrogenase [Euryarchaeota archaeon RBG_13_61_15]